MLKKLDEEILENKFEVKDLRNFQYFVGMEVAQSN